MHWHLHSSMTYTMQCPNDYKRGGGGCDEGKWWKIIQYEGHATQHSDFQTQHLHFIRADTHTHFRAQRFHLEKKAYNSNVNIIEAGAGLCMRLYNV
jgi:hypothetical protein